MTTNQLIKIYTKRLETVKKMWSGKDSRGMEYISRAEYNLFAVQNGRKW